MNNILRRGFVAGSAGFAGLTLFSKSVSAIDPFMRTAPGRMSLSLAAYSLRDKLTK